MNIGFQVYGYGRISILVGMVVLRRRGDGRVLSSSCKSDFEFKETVGLTDHREYTTSSLWRM